ncbi:MAG TPA: YeeE/YedE family protein [Hyphomicrobium sp.]|nr:YeeE/YedE family protein [Hyphomicrobium sp.]
MTRLWNFAAGVVFGVGLIIAGMINPAKVLNFLDIAGLWDPSLAFVMAGAIAVTAIGYRIGRTRARPLFDETFRWPTATAIDWRLIAGAAIFGVGWGLVGLCPGPAIASLILAAPATLVFVPAMLIGIWSAVRLRR